jgi:hypothetical protein
MGSGITSTGSGTGSATDAQVKAFVEGLKSKFPAIAKYSDAVKRASAGAAAAAPVAALPTDRGELARLGATGNMEALATLLSQDAESARAEYEVAKKDAAARIAKMEGEINTYQAGYNEAWMTSTLARERQYWDQQIEATMKGVDERLASLGRTANPYMMGRLRQGLASKAADALQVRRTQLEQERSNYMMGAMQLRNDFYKNIQVEAPDQTGLYNLISSAAQAKATQSMYESELALKRETLDQQRDLTTRELDIQEAQLRKSGTKRMLVSASGVQDVRIG